MPISSYYTAPFTGATSRDLTEKLSDFVTPMDFGAVGDGEADDTAAVQAALDTGQHVLLVSSTRGVPGKFVKHLITAPLNVTTDGQRISGATGANYLANASIYFPTLGENQAVINIQASGVVLDSLTIKGYVKPTPATPEDPFAFPLGSRIIFANEDASVGPDFVNNGDVDLTISDCALGEAETLVKITGRTVRITDCNLVRARDVLEIDWPADFVNGTNYDNTAQAGMRGYTIRDNRIHGCTGGYVVTNLGANRANLRGLTVIGNLIDTNIRLFRGVAKDSLFSDNVVIHSAAAGPLVYLEAGSDSVRVASNVFYGMEDNGEGTTRKMYSGVLIAQARNVSVDGNHFKRVDNSVVEIGSGSVNVSVRNNVMKDVGLANFISPVADRAPVRVNGSNGPIDGLMIDGNTIDNALRPLDGNGETVFLPLVGISNPTLTEVTNLSIGSNVLPADMYASDFVAASATFAPSLLDTARKAVAYQGDGSATQSFVLRFSPAYVTVTITTGPDRGRSMSIAASDLSASDIVEISGRVVTVKGAWNAASTGYTLFAAA